MFDTLLEASIFAIVCVLLVHCRITLISTRVKLKDAEIRLRWANQTLNKIKGDVNHEKSQRIRQEG